MLREDALVYLQVRINDLIHDLTKEYEYVEYLKHDLEDGYIDISSKNKFSYLVTFYVMNRMFK